jgi:hypothetical protein
MNTSKDYLVQDKPHTRHCSVKKSAKISLSLFQKTILANTAMRKQIKDVVDLALYDFALQKNSELIESMRKEAEAETLRLMMRFLHGISDYRALSKIIHRNWVIKTLANLDRNDQAALINRVTHLVAV